MECTTTASSTSTNSLGNPPEQNTGFPTLLQLSLKASISNKLFEKTKGKLAEYSEKDKKLILEWEYKQICEGLSKTCGNEIHYEVKKIDAFRDMIKFVMDYNYSGYRISTIYGGFLRDYVFRHDHNFNDIDMRFDDMEQMEMFISHVMDRYNVTICENTIPHHRAPIPIDTVCHHRNVRFNDGLGDSKYENETVLKTIRVTDSQTNASIQMDLTLRQDNPTIKDFDVNMLEMRRGHINNNDETITKHIENKQFVVISRTGIAKLTHRDASYIHAYTYSKISEKEHICDMGDCFCRCSSKGQKLAERIKKMQEKGWTMLNEPCTNPMCILAPTKLYDAYVKDVLERQKLEKLAKERHFKRKLQKKEMALEMKQLEKQVEFFSGKDMNTLHYDRQHNPKHNKAVIHFKTDFKNYKKSVVNKRHVFVEADDYDWARGIEYVDDDEDDNDDINTEWRNIVIHPLSSGFSNQLTFTAEWFKPIVQPIEPDPLKEERVFTLETEVMIEIKQLEKQYIYLNEKEANTSHFEKKFHPKCETNVSHFEKKFHSKQCKAKTYRRNYRKDLINKKQVWYGPDDYESLEDDWQFADELDAENLFI